jgi:hypothetical protein
MNTVRIPREPKEVHSRHEDGVRWIEEGQGPERLDHVRILKLLIHKHKANFCNSFLREETK